MTFAPYRHHLPQLSGQQFLTDGGLETTLVFHDGFDLPHFAAFDLMRTAEGRAHLKDYYRRYARLAQDFGVGLIIETPTWRAQPGWGARIGYNPVALEAINRECIELGREIRAEFETPQTPYVISGNLGPRGDGYQVGTAMSAAEAEDYHAWQIGIFADAGADMVALLTATYVEEAIGVARAAKVAGLPCAISFTLETDGRLPSGQPLKEAILQADGETGEAPAYYMINCAHPTHFQDVLASDAPWLERIRGIRANASRMSHAELDNSETLDEGDPRELGGQYGDLLERLPGLSVFGGCCGTDHRHVEAIGFACIGEPRGRPAEARHA
ncbi:homocysteine methyltransferase [Hartmannibacter diazotrophicus]|uniref:Homocysteine methyltransferase n=1 Tax=Hartmannibacter diazotrophicus TaxID=1482074 RepID=A0A2C9CZW6_9HYPH|nr:homocysteine S-methyltransferase family protein [Hartmannibacter diazotrophicus]SON53687.1 homocysteine methyltransferase [Hartmannibacter diazotrophicus]